MSSDSPMHPEVEQVLRDRQRISNLEDTIESLQDYISQIERRLQNLEDTPFTKEAKVEKLVQTARTLRTKDQGAVVLDAKQIVAATGVSLRYAYDLCDSLPNDYEWILSRQEISNRQYGSLEIDHDELKRGIAIDFELLETFDTEGSRLNLFNNGDGGAHS